MKSKILLILFAFCLNSFGQSVPNTNTFTLQDVVNVTGGTSLSAAFAAANGTFDPSYVGSKNSLYNFRNYQKNVGVKYGYLYNWYAATDSRNIANIGWHLPTLTELETCRTVLGGLTIAGGKLKEEGLTHWLTPNTGADNSSGFSGVGSGLRSRLGVFSGIKNESWIMSSSVRADNVVYYGLYIQSQSESCNNTQSMLATGETIRLIKDSTTLTNGQTGSYVGNDGRVYKTICIGTQEWIAENLAETKYRNGDVILTVTDQTTWTNLTTGAKCAYNNDESNVVY